jgi:hypothetical protein
MGVSPGMGWFVPLVYPCKEKAPAQGNAQGIGGVPPQRGEQPRRGTPKGWSGGA